MMNFEVVIETLKRYGKMIAQALQDNAENMTGTELNTDADYIPSFTAAVAKMNMLERPVGFVCKSTAGRVVKLLQNYDSTVFTAEPEELPAQWGFVWSKDPNHAKPFVALATSPYNKDECCTDDGVVYRSLIDTNTWKPSDYPAGWEAVKSNG